MNKSKEEKLRDFFTYAFYLLLMNKESKFSKQLKIVSNKIEQKIKGDEKLLQLFLNYKKCLIGHILEIKHENSEDFVNRNIAKVLEQED